MSFDLPALPDGWTFEPLDSCCQSGSITYGIVQPGSPVSQGVPIVRVNNFRDMHLDLTDVMHVSPAIASKYERTKLQGGEVLLTIVGTVGQVAVAPANLAGFNVARAVAVIHPLPTISADWIALCLRSPLSRHMLVSRANTTVQTTINLKDLRALPIPIPTDRERKEICALIGALDDRIALLRETNATLEAIAQALFKSWFVDFDPVRARMEGRAPDGMDEATAALFPDSFEESAQGFVPKGWSMSTLGAICNAYGGSIQTGPFGSQLHAADYVAEGIPVVMPKDISMRRVDVDTAARIHLEDVKRLSRHQLAVGDIVFSRRGDVEKHALIGETERGWLCGTGCLLVRPGAKWKSPGYLSRALDLPITKQWLTQHAVGATMPNLNTGILSSVPVLLPSDDVVVAFERVTTAFDERISENNATAQTLTNLRDTLLPRLISGQLRLPVAETMLEASV